MPTYEAYFKTTSAFRSLWVRIEHDKSRGVVSFYDRENNAVSGCTMNPDNSQFDLNLYFPRSPSRFFKKAEWLGATVTEKYLLIMDKSTALKIRKWFGGYVRLRRVPSESIYYPPASPHSQST